MFVQGGVRTNSLDRRVQPPYSSRADRAAARHEDPKQVREVWCGMIWYGMVWYGMVWYAMVWYGMDYTKHDTIQHRKSIILRRMQILLVVCLCPFHFYSVSAI